MELGSGPVVHDLAGLRSTQGAIALSSVAASALTALLRQSHGRVVPGLGNGRRSAGVGDAAEAAGRVARIHTDRAAAKAADMLGAEAFTLGLDVYFAAEAFAPGSVLGDALIAHELRHATQFLGAEGFQGDRGFAAPVAIAGDKHPLEQTAREGDALDANRPAPGLILRSPRILPPTPGGQRLRRWLVPESGDETWDAAHEKLRSFDLESDDAVLEDFADLGPPSWDSGEPIGTPLQDALRDVNKFDGYRVHWATRAELLAMLRRDLACLAKEALDADGRHDTYERFEANVSAVSVAHRNAMQLALFEQSNPNAVAPPHAPVPNWFGTRAYTTRVHVIDAPSPSSAASWLASRSAETKALSAIDTEGLASRDLAKRLQTAFEDGISSDDTEVLRALYTNHPDSQNDPSIRPFCDALASSLLQAEDRLGRARRVSELTYLRDALTIEVANYLSASASDADTAEVDNALGGHLATIIALLQPFQLHGQMQRFVERLSSGILDETIGTSDVSDVLALLPPPGQGGAPPPVWLRLLMEAAFDADFGRVKLFQNEAAARATSRLGTVAFTRGQDIFLSPMASLYDLTMMAHEFAHVRQFAVAGQKAAPRTEGPGPGRVALAIPRGASASEAEARRAAERVASGKYAGAIRASPGEFNLYEMPWGTIRDIPGQGGPAVFVVPNQALPPDVLLAFLNDGILRRSEDRILFAIMLGDRPSWRRARIEYEAAGASLLATLEDELDEDAFAEARPYLRGVISTEDLLKTRAGFFSADTHGVHRTIEAAPDAELRGFVHQYMLKGSLKGTRIYSLFRTIGATMQGEGDYKARRMLIARIERLAAKTGEEALNVFEQDAVERLLSELRIHTAFQRIQDADRAERMDLAWLSITDLNSSERRALAHGLLLRWQGRYIKGYKRQILLAQLEFGDQVWITRTALQSANRWGSEDDEESRYAYEVAVGAFGEAVSDLQQTANSDVVTERERDEAGSELHRLRRDRDLHDRLMTLPGGEALMRQRLRVSEAELARRKLVKNANNIEDVMETLRGLHELDVQSILTDPEVRERFQEKDIYVGHAHREVLKAYGRLSAAEPTGSGVVGLDGTFSLQLDIATVGAGLGDPSIRFSLPEGFDEIAFAPEPVRPSAPPEYSAVPPEVTVAAYEAEVAASRGDLPKLVAIYRRLRPYHREEVQYEPSYINALSILEDRGDTASEELARLLDSAYTPLEDITAVLYEAGVHGSPGYPWGVSEMDYVAEALAVDPRDRRMLRYEFALDRLSSERRHGLPIISRLHGFEPPEHLRGALLDRESMLWGLDEYEQIQLQDIFLGEPEVTRSDLTPEEAGLEAEFMRIRLDQQISALSRGLDPTGTFGWTPQAVDEVMSEFRRLYTIGSEGGWTRAEAIHLSKAYYDVLDTIDRNRGARNEVASLAATIAGVVAGVVVIIATAGTGTPFVVGVLAGAGLGAGAAGLVAPAFRDYTSDDQALSDVTTGAVSGALTVAGEALAAPVGGIASRAVARTLARTSLRRGVQRGLTAGTRLAVEGMIDGAVGGAGEAVFRTAMDEATWNRGVNHMFARFLSATLEGAFTGAATGFIAAPVFGAGMNVAGRAARSIGRAGGGLLRRAGVDLSDILSTQASRLDEVASIADSGRIDVALRKLDEIDLTPAVRRKITDDLYHRAAGRDPSTGALTPELIRHVESARAAARRLRHEPGGRRLDTNPIERLLARLERELGASQMTHLRKIVYGEFRLPPERLIPMQHTFRRELDDAVARLSTPEELVRIPPFEVRVLPPEAFDGMFPTYGRAGEAVTVEEGGVAVVYARAGADPSKVMRQEAAHLRQLGDPALAPDIRRLSEASLANWSEKAAVDRLDLVNAQLRLEIEAQERLIRMLDREGPFGMDPLAATAEADFARRYLNRLQEYKAEADAITPDQLTEMNAGLRAKPDWMEDPARLFARSVSENRPAQAVLDAATPVRVHTSSGLKSGERAFQRGQSWMKETVVSSDVNGRVTTVRTLRDGTFEVRVKPDNGGNVRSYIIEAHGQVAPGITKNGRVGAGQRLGTDTREYRLVEIQDGSGRVIRTRDEIRTLGTRERWVERGSSRTRRGDIMEEAAELQIRARTKLPFHSSPRQIWLETSSRRGGFDRHYVEVFGSGTDLVARIKVLEVKTGYPSSVPIKEFTAIRENWATNWDELARKLRTEITALRVANDHAAADAIERALLNKDVTVEIWLGPTTNMGAETATNSVLGRLRAEIDGYGGNIQLSPGYPRRVKNEFHTAAVDAQPPPDG